MEGSIYLRYAIIFIAAITAIVGLIIIGTCLWNAKMDRKADELKKRTSKINQRLHNRGD